MANQKSKLSGGAGGKPAVKTAVKSDVKTDMKTGAKTGAKPRARATKPPPIFLPPKPPSIFSKFRTNFLTGISSRSACRYDYLPHLGGRWGFLMTVFCH